MSVNSAEIKNITRTFYINEVAPYVSWAGKKMKKCVVLENGKEVYYSYNNERLSDSLVVNNCIDRLMTSLLVQNYQGMVIIYLNSQFVGFDTREDMGFFFSSYPGKPPQILLRLKYLEKQQINLANEILKSLPELG